MEHREKFIVCPECGHGDHTEVVDPASTSHQGHTHERTAIYECVCSRRGKLIIDPVTGEERVEGDLCHVTDPDLYEPSERAR